MRLRGECLACSKLGECGETSEEKVLQSFTCMLFAEAPEAVYVARWVMMKQYGEQTAVRAMLAATHEEEEELEDA